MADFNYLDYELWQYSLSNYKLINNDTSDIHYNVYSFIYGKETEINKGVVTPDNDTMLVMPNDGIFIIRLKFTEDGDTFVTYVVHNIMEVLKKRQQYLTNILRDAIIEDCDSHSYYDYISFNILFNTYIYLVEKLLIGKTDGDNINIVPSAIPYNLYEVEDIYNKLMEYC